MPAQQNLTSPLALGVDPAIGNCHGMCRTWESAQQLVFSSGPDNSSDNPEVRLLDTLAALDRASDRASVQDSRTDTAAGMAAWPAARLATGLSQQALPHFL